jgi:CheY-like chemotaxis protein
MLPHNPTVLVVEDEVLVRLDLTEALEVAGYLVRHAHSAEEACGMLETDETICVAFLDIVLPGMDGLSFARVIRERWPHVIIVYASGNIDVTQPVEPKDALLLPKPYEISRLKPILADVNSRLREL